MAETTQTYPWPRYRATRPTGSELWYVLDTWGRRFFCWPEVQVPCCYTQQDAESLAARLNLGEPIR